MKTPTRSSLRLVLATLALLALALPASLMATDYTYSTTASATQYWTNTTGWSPTGLPGAGDNATISWNLNATKNFRLTGDRTVDNLTLFSGVGGVMNIGDAGYKLTVADTLKITGGTNALSPNVAGKFTVETANLVNTNNANYRLRIGRASAGYNTDLTVTGYTTNGGIIEIMNGDQAVDFGHLENNKFVDLGTSTVGSTNYTVKASSLSGSSAGSISNSAAVHTTLEIGGLNTNAVSYGGSIVDGGGVITLVKKGSGSQTLTGNNTYTGGTLISGGVLRIGNGGGSGDIAGNITNNATLELARNNKTWTNLISGTGNLRLLGGAGTTNILSADNTYSGGTEISTGTLQLGDGGTTGTAGTGAITNNVALQVNRSDTYTLGNTVSGTGAFRQNGTGTTILTANNTYEGTTAVNDGTLQMGNGGTSGTIGIGTNNLTIGSSGKFVVNRSDTISMANVINGSGGFEQAGTGTTILAASSSSFNGGILVSAGTLNVGGGVSGAALGSGAITNNATLVFERTSGSHLGNSIQGNGTLIFRGTSKVLFYNDSSSYAGNVLIESGARFQLGSSADTYASGAIGGAITNNGELTIFRNNSATVTNVISGTGVLIKDGTGETILTALNTYTGNTTVTDGKLTLDSGAGLTFLIGANGVNNAIGGTSTLQLDGAFTFDLSGADTTDNNTWGIVDMNSLAASYGGTFAVNSTLGAFTENANVWSLDSGGKTWSFTEATGVLTVVPEPHVNLLLALSALALGILAWKRKTVASASSR